MTLIDDKAVLNTANACTVDYVASGFDGPQNNTGASATEIYREGGSCCEWILKDGITDGYANEIQAFGIPAGAVIMNWFFFTSDADMNKLSEFWLQVSTSTSNITAGNWAAWDIKDKFSNLDLYGWFPVVVYPTDATGNQPDETSTTHITDFTTGLNSYGWRGSTGGVGTKLSGFDQTLTISYVGGHSQDFSFANLYTHAVTNDLGIAFKFGDFYKFQVNVRLGGGTTTNASLIQNNVVVFFDNERPAHNLGFVFANNTTGTNHFELNDTVVTWNDQDSADSQAQVFTDALSADVFRLDGCNFARGGQFRLRSVISSANTYVKNTTITGCDYVDANTMLFQDNTITAARDANGSLLIGASGTSNITGPSFISGGAGHAMRFESTGSYTLTNFTYSGFGANNTTDAVLYNDSGGAITVTISGGDIPTVRNGTGGTTNVVAGAVDFTVTGINSGSDVLLIDDTDERLVVAQEENNTTGTFTHTHTESSRAIILRVIDLDTQIITIDGLFLNSTAQSIPIQPRTDRVYSNP